jgi:hypothetical protein
VIHKIGLGQKALPLSLQFNHASSITQAMQPPVKFKCNFLTLLARVKLPSWSDIFLPTITSQNGSTEDSAGRFIKPGVAGVKDERSEQRDDDRTKKRSGDDGDEPPDLHPFVQGLLKELPKAGDIWPEDQRRLWLDTAASIFKMIYKDQPATPFPGSPVKPPPYWNERGRQLRRRRLGAGQFNRLRVVFVGELTQFPLSLPVANSVGEGTAFVGLIF